VTGVDVSADLVAAASARAAGLDNVRFAVADASTWQPEQAPVCLAPWRDVLSRTAGRFRAPRHSRAGRANRLLLLPHPARESLGERDASLLPESGASASAPPPTSADPFAPGPFAFADPDHVRTCLRGWRDVTFTPVDFDYIAGAGPDAVAEALAFFGRIGPRRGRSA
jgi:hypothetical protein